MSRHRFHQLGIGGQLEAVAAVGLQPEGAPAPQHGGVAETHRLGHAADGQWVATPGVDSRVFTTTTSTCASLIFVAAPHCQDRRAVQPVPGP